MDFNAISNYDDDDACSCFISNKLYLKSVSWRLTESYYNRGLQKPHTRTCTILQETINRFLRPLIVFLESKTHQLNFEDVIELNRNLQ